MRTICLCLAIWLLAVPLVNSLDLDTVEVEGEVISPTQDQEIISPTLDQEMVSSPQLSEQELFPDVVNMKDEEIITVANLSGADQGNWTLGYCIIVKMAAELTIKPNKTNSNTTIILEVPVSAVVADTSSCADSNTTQTITLQWSEGDFNRNISLHFSKNGSQYGVSKIDAVYELRNFNTSSQVPGPDNTTVWVNTTVLEYISLSTFGMSPWVFLVPENRSYLCSNINNIQMIAELHRTDENGGSPGERLTNSTLSAKKVQFDAFRGSNTYPDEFQSPSDCNYRPNDVVPIIVGCALAGLVLMVLVAYLIGRRKSRARGYQSV